MEITLRKVTHENLQELVSLSVGEAQRGFVASNSWSIMEAYTTVT